jgi:hypothetical protein
MTCSTCKNSRATVMVAGGFLCLCEIDGEYHRTYATRPDDTDLKTEKV